MEYNEIVAELHTTKPDVLNRMVTLAKKQRQLENEMAEMAKRGKELLAELENITGGHRVEGSLPKVMTELGLSEFTLDDGSKIEIKSVLQPPSLAKDAPHRDAVLKWLKDNGHSGVIKAEVKVPLAPGDPKEPGLVAALTTLGLKFDEYETVAAPTLKSLIDELMEKGQDVPMEELHIHSFKTSKVTLPK